MKVLKRNVCLKLLWCNSQVYSSGLFSSIFHSLFGYLSTGRHYYVCRQTGWMSFASQRFLFRLITISFKRMLDESKHCVVNNCLVIHFKRISLPWEKHLTSMKEILNNTCINLIVQTCWKLLERNLNASLVSFNTT